MEGLQGCWVDEHDEWEAAREALEPDPLACPVLVAERQRRLEQFAAESEAEWNEIWSRFDQLVTANPYLSE